MYEVEASTNTVKAGDGWGGCSVINPSYLATGYYKQFGEIVGSKDQWEAVVAQSYSVVSKLNGHNSGTGLLPDWTNCNGDLGNSAVSSFCKDSGRDFWFDAVRVPWRMALAGAWGCDTAALQQASALEKFFSSQGGPGEVKTGYTVDGSSLGGHDTGCFLAMASTVFVHSTNDIARGDFWQALKGSNPNSYFCDSLRLLALLFNAGLMTAQGGPPPPPPPPPAPQKWWCSSTSGTCIISPRGTLAPNSTGCEALCELSWHCNSQTQQCESGDPADYPNKAKCQEACNQGSCSNKPYAQCGGTGWTGATCCPDGYKCEGSGYYYQCMPSR
jgi:hypothetical protein